LLRHLLLLQLHKESQLLLETSCILQQGQRCCLLLRWLLGWLLLLLGLLLNEKATKKGYPDRSGATLVSFWFLVCFALWLPFGSAGASRRQNPGETKTKTKRNNHDTNTKQNSHRVGTTSLPNNPDHIFVVFSLLRCSEGLTGLSCCPLLHFQKLLLKFLHTFRLGTLLGSSSWLSSRGLHQ
jgi:hypothetical protein